MSKQPAFGTILIRRKSNERPPGKSLIRVVSYFYSPLAIAIVLTLNASILLPMKRLKDWELRLRPMCQKIRIVEKLNGNPHLMVAGSPSVAVRFYNIHDVQRLEKELSSEDNDPDDNNRRVDGLKQFRTSYEHSIVFFILPSNHQRDQLSRRDSFFHRAQRTNIRILIVADVSQALTAISFVQSLASEKREKKKKYFAQIAEQNYLPSLMTGGVEPTQETIANYAKDALTTWAERMEMQRGDINVALDMLGSIAGVVTASNGDLDSIPITSASKDVIRHFFGGIARDEKATDDSNLADEDSEMFGGIDDAELLNIPDPSPAAELETLDQNVYFHGEGYDEYDLPHGGHSSYEQHSSYQNQARDFYTPINPSFARRRFDHVQQQDHYVSQYGYPSDAMDMNSSTRHYPSANNYSHQGEYDDYNDYSRSMRQYTNQFM